MGEGDQEGGWIKHGKRKGWVFWHSVVFGNNIAPLAPGARRPALGARRPGARLKRGEKLVLVLTPPSSTFPFRTLRGSLAHNACPRSGNFLSVEVVAPDASSGHLVAFHDQPVSSRTMRFVWGVVQIAGGSRSSPKHLPDPLPEFVLLLRAIDGNPRAVAQPLHRG